MRCLLQEEFDKEENKGQDEKPVDRKEAKRTPIDYEKTKISKFFRFILRTNLTSRRTKAVVLISEYVFCCLFHTLLRQNARKYLVCTCAFSSYWAKKPDKKFAEPPNLKIRISQGGRAKEYEVFRARQQRGKWFLDLRACSATNTTAFFFGLPFGSVWTFCIFFSAPLRLSKSADHQRNC